MGDKTLDNYEDDFYDIIARISNTNAPIVFKGGLITKLILHENNYHNISRYTIGIDADWIDSMPDMTDVEKQLNDSLQNGEKPYRAVVTRAPDVKKSVGIEIIIMNDETKLYLFMDETGRPYEEGENPFPNTPEDDEFDRMLLKKLGLVLAEDENETDS